MKPCSMAAGLLAAIVLFVPVGSADVSPVSQVISMISKLQQQVIQEGQEDQKVYNEFAEMCSDRSLQLHQEVKTGKAGVVRLSGAIDKAAADLAMLEDKISDLAASLADTEEELKKATAMRAKESGDFKDEEKELMTSISAIERAIGQVEKGGAFAQVKNVDSITGLLGTMTEALAINSDDAARLTALVQSSSEASDEEEFTGAPSPAVYQNQGGTIVDTLGGLLEKTQKSLQDARNAETNAQNAYDMLKQSLEAKMKTSTKEMGDAKKSKASTHGDEASAQGSLADTKGDLKESEKTLAILHLECVDKAQAFQDATVAHGEQLKALAEAKKIIVEATGAAAQQTYGLAQTSFLQVAMKMKSRSRMGSASSEALNKVRHLAMKYPSKALLELSRRIEKTVRSSSMRNTDPFVKVRSMIEGMIGKLQDEAEDDAKKKAYCDKEMFEAQMSKDDKDESVEHLTTQIDVISSESIRLKEEVKRLEKETAEMMREQAELDKLRQKEKAIYEKQKPELEQGIEGVKTALNVLRDYYAKDDSAQSGSGTGIIGMLEVVESDFTKGLAEMKAVEETSKAEYEEASNENEVAKETKDVDVKGRTQQYVGLEKVLAELAADKTGVESELSAVMEYFTSIKKQCIAQPDSYEEVKKRREQLMGGLKGAMDTLEGQAVFLQTGMAHRLLRGK